MHVPLTEVILTHGGAELARATFAPGEYIIGREPGVDLHADTPLLSRQHARLTINYDHLLLEDLGSSNGTFVNDQPVAEATRLFPNQSIRLGPDIVLEIRRQRAPSEPGVSLAPAQAAIRRHLPDELLGEKRYATGGIIARGGMGAILDARQRATKRTVAMKVMLDTGDEAAVLRFIEEAQVTAQLDHPNIVPIYELGVDEQDQLFYTMKMVRGITLKKVLELLAQGVPETVKKYPLPVLLTVFQKVCDALAFAHSKGVIHRDLKPENLMLGDFGSVLVMDWGLAKVIGKKDAPGVDVTRSAVISARSAEPELSGTMAGSIMGTPAYMSPEQARGEIETLDARSDIYALGAILFEILHLRPAVTGRAALEIVDKVTRGEVEWDAQKSARLPDSLLAVCRKALALAPAARYPRVEDLQTDLLAYQSGFATSAEKAGAWKQLTLFIRRHKTATLGAAAVLFVGTAFGTKAVIEGRRAERALADLRKTAPTFFSQARALLDAGKFDEAIEKAGYAIQLDGANADYHLSHAHLLEATQHLAEAAAGYRRVLALRPGDESAKTNLALCERLLAENGGAPTLRRELQNQLRAALLAQKRLVEAGSLNALLDPDLAIAEAALRARLREYQKQPGWKDNRIERQPNGTFRVDLHDLALGDLSLLKGQPISALDLAGTGITDLRGIAGLPLKSLNLKGSKVSDLSPLRGVPLEDLTLDGNPVSDLSPLIGMKLRRLALRRTSVPDLRLLAGMPLKEFYAEGSVKYFDALAGMPLEVIDLSHAHIPDLSWLRGCPLKYLIFSWSDIGDLSPLRGSSVKHVNLTGSTVPDLSPLAECPNLRELILPNNRKGIGALRSLPNLQFKYDGNSRVTLSAAEFWAEYDAQQANRARFEKNLAQVRAALPALGMIATDRTKVVEPWGVYADLLEQPVTDVTGLRQLPIDYLSLHKTQVTDLAPLRGMRLKQICFDATPVKDVSPLLDLPILEAAMVPQRATNLEVLRRHPTLKYLGWENDWDADANRSKLTTAEFWTRYDAQQKTGAK